MTNTFETDISNANFNSAQYYVDDDGSFKFVSPILASSNFDGSVPIFEGEIDAEDLSTGMLIKLDDDQFYGIISIFKDDPDLEDSPSTDITIQYLDSNNDEQTITYDFLDTVTVRYEDWDEKYLGTQGWALTYGGNAIFANVGVRGDLEATTLDVGGANGITYDGTEVIIGASVTILGGITIGDVESYLQSASYATDSDLEGFITGEEVNPNVTSISGGAITTGTISAITFQTNLSGRRSKLGAGDAYIPSNWSTTIQPRTGGGGSTTYTPTGLEFFDQNNNRTGYLYSLDRYNSGVFSSTSRTLVFGTTDTSGNDTGTEIIIGNVNLSLYAPGLADIFGDDGARLFSDNCSLTVGAFGSDEITVNAQRTTFSLGETNASAVFYSNIYAQSGYKYYGDGSGLTNVPAPAGVVYTSFGYSDPSWITSLAGSKISGNISGNANNITLYTINQNLGTGNNVSFNTITATSNGNKIAPSTFTNPQTPLQIRGSDNVIGIQSSTLDIKTEIIPLNGETLDIVPAEKSGGGKENLSINPDDIFKISPVEYLVIEDETQSRQIGFIVEDLLNTWPSAVTYSGENPISYNTNSIVAGLVYAVKKQKEIIEDLQNRVLQLESQLGG